mmetsp:Transcript_14784/g.27362  ORF Transcript_14784/g.27362 Transcript_14784/m.27362 type:complete len:393 (+) Transcript_14784:1775-2953(+)
MFFQPHETSITKQQSDLQYIQNHSTMGWAKAFLTDLKNSRKNSVAFDFLHHGLGDKVKIIALKRSFKNLEENYFIDIIKKSNNCALFLDVEGTLCETYTNNDIDTSEGPSQSIIRALNNLASKTKFSIYVITGRKREILERWFANAPKVGLAAEYGSYIRHSDTTTWDISYEQASKWRETAIRIIQNYVERTDGSYIEEKGSSIVFQYREADPDYGSLQAKELCSHLEILLIRHMNECEVSSGLGYVEVKPKGINKGSAVLKLLEHIVSTKGPVDMLFAAGDDIADEEMFRMLHKLKTEQRSLTINKDKLAVISCTIGQKPSDADYFMSDYEPFIQLMKIVENFVEAKRSVSIPRVSSLRMNLLAPSKIRENEREEQEGMSFENSENEEDLG